MVTKTCARCDRWFTSTFNRAKFCSEECRRGQYDCETCGTQFLRTHGSSGRFCSTACWYAAPGKKVLVPVQCQVCQEEFQPANSTTKFCSFECKIVGMRTAWREKQCELCGGTYQTKAALQRFCSKSCARTGHRGTVPIGTRRTEKSGYVMLKTDNGWKLEHRSIMERKLGRSLLATKRVRETVHHKNGIRNDNSIRNLELWVVGQPKGQRPKDLIAYVVNHHREAVESALNK